MYTFMSIYVYTHEHIYVHMCIVGRNINNLRYADDTTLMSESTVLKNLLMKVKEESENIDLAQHSEN